MTGQISVQTQPQLQSSNERFAGIKTITLNDGNKIPVLAFGTGTAQAWTDSAPVVHQAINSGMRHFDCAWHYKNQMYTGPALKDSGITRDQIFITTKGGNYDGDPKDFDAKYFLEVGLKDLGLDYVDLYLVHADILIDSPTRAWKQMEQIKKDGLARSIGVSNFSTSSLKEVLAMCEIPPAVNQIEFHPYSLPTYLPTLLPLCKAHDIKIECFGSLMSLNRHHGGPVDDVVRRIISERARGETEGQVLLMWAQQITQGVVVTTTNNAERMVEQLIPFLQDSLIPQLSDSHLRAISEAGASAPFRFWGSGYPYFMKGEGGIEACAPEATHIKPKINGTDGPQAGNVTNGHTNGVH